MLPIADCTESVDLPPVLRCKVGNGRRDYQIVSAYDALVRFGQPYFIEMLVLDDASISLGFQACFCFRFCCTMHSSTCPERINVPDGTVIQVNEFKY